jgi:cytochrome b
MATPTPRRVWDAPTRWFHWTNLVLVLLLAGSGFFFMYREAFHVTGREAKMALKIAHVWIGYAFTLVLAARVAWAFIGSPSARWRAILPDRNALRGIGDELRGLRDRRLVRHPTRSPLSRLSATVMFALLLLLALTGLFRAATDLYHSPLGPAVARFVARQTVDPTTLSWQNEETLADPQRMARLNRIKQVAGLPHRVAAWLLSAMIVAHITGVVLTEVRQRSGLISAMVSGVAADQPPDGAPDPAPPAA